MVKIIKHINSGKIYRVLHSKVKMKIKNGLWINGFAYYKPGESLDIYVRPMDELDRFEVIE